MFEKDKETRMARRPRFRVEVPRVWSPKSVFEEIDRWFEDVRNDLDSRFWGPSYRLGRGLATRAVRSPALDIKDTGKELIVTAELPGVNKEDVEIHVTREGLELRAETKSEAEKDEEGYSYRERGYRSFYRSVALPAEVVPDSAKASLTDGLLEVRIPKVEPTPEARPFKVKVQ